MKAQIKTMSVVPNASNQDINRCVLLCVLNMYYQRQRFFNIIWGVIIRRFQEGCLLITVFLVTIATHSSQKLLKLVLLSETWFFKTKLFVNYYVLENATLAEPKCIKCIFTQNFWYSMIQLVNGQRPTNSRLISEQLLSSFDSFKTSYPSAVKLFPGLSQAITEACTEIATSYTSSIVENFEEKLLYFFIYKKRTAFV
ncbi:hypothetical protein BDF20DRAFT_999733, partial [Mycotypha africana]|uniref:uncharacterized protein n=1 Tax=Mycotypha africana TaxID=64632 RepID=UPI002300B7E6